MLIYSNSVISLYIKKGMFCQSFLTQTLGPSKWTDHNISRSVHKLWPEVCTKVQPCLWKPADTRDGRDASADLHKTRSVKTQADTLKSYSIYSHEQKRGGSPELDTHTHTHRHTHRHRHPMVTLSVLLEKCCVLLL